METAQINSPRFNYQTATAAPPRTLDDMRMVHGISATEGNFSAKASRPLLISVAVVIAVAGAAIGLHRYSESTTEKINATAATTDASLPSASSVKTPEITTAPTAKDSPATNPLSPMTKSEEANSMPLAGQGNNHSSESLNPVKAKSSTTAKSIAKPVAPPAAAATQITPPSAPVIEEKPVVPPPAPISEPAPTTPPELPKQ